MRAARNARLIAGALSVACYAATIFAFRPGYLTTDSAYVYSFMQEWRFGDWQSPLMSILWGLVDPIAPGAGSMFVLTASLYWLAFGLLAVTIARRSAWIAIAVSLLALLPSAVLMLSMIWRDILFAVIWLLGAAIVYAAAERGTSYRWPAQALALGLIGLGVLLRPNAAIAAAPLVTYALWPTRLDWKRTALAFVPAVIVGVVLVQVVYYGILHVQREHPESSLMVFDLGGITHFTSENQFPVTWSESETTLLTTTCYDPEHWDSYWTLAPCDFVMKRLEDPSDMIFGTTRLTLAWARAIVTHPVAYLRHRATFFWRFLWGDNLTLDFDDLDDPRNAAFAQNPHVQMLRAVSETLSSTPLFRTGSWLLLAIAIVIVAWRRRLMPSGAFAVGVAACGVIYVMTFLLVGVADDFRYGYWCVLASLAGGATTLAAYRA